MSMSIEKSRALFPGTTLHDGAQIDSGCRIDPGCEISAETIIKLNVAICKNTVIMGAVKIDMGVIVRENVTLVGPLHISRNVYIAHDAVIGATRMDDTLKDKETTIGEYSRIGKEVEIIGGVQVGRHTKIRAGSLVIGDVPHYGLASRSPAILEGFVCPKCGDQLRVQSTIVEISVVRCPHCNKGEFEEGSIRLSRKDQIKYPRRVLLPNGAVGEQVSILGDDLRWLDEWEMR